MDAKYSGRFAPSPTGPLHLGSLITAVASYLDARASGGSWRLRIDDIDPPRHDQTSFESIPSCLQAHGLTWDGDVIRQSLRRSTHDQYLKELEHQGLTFTCVCTRTSLGSLGQCEADCSSRRHRTGSVRFKVPDDLPNILDDLILGSRVTPRLPANFVIRRRDGLIAYQLATAVDDLDELYTHVIRGADLLESGYRQMAIQSALGRQSPRYGHIPILYDQQGNKLSKQTGAAPVDIQTPDQNLKFALRFLNQSTALSDTSSVRDILEHAIDHWNPKAIAPPGV